MKFRKKPVEIEAMHISTDTERPARNRLDPNTEDIARVSGWMLGNGFRDFRVHGDGPFGITIQTLEGVMVASPGDWIIREPFPTVVRLFYPCKPDIFEATYEPVDAEGGEPT